MKFEVKAPDGRTVVLEGDSAPTDSDLDEIFASLPAKKTETGTVGGGIGEAFDVNPYENPPLPKKEEPMAPVVKWAANRMAKEGRTDPSLLESALIGIGASGAGSQDALQSVGEGMAQGATLGGYGRALDYATGALGRGDLSYSSRKQNREDKYGGWETGVHTLSEIAGSIPTGKTIFKGINAGVARLPKYGSSLSDGLLPKTLAGMTEGSIHGGITNGKKGAITGGIIGGAIPLSIAGVGAGIKYAGKGAKHLLGLYTGTSPESVQQAYDAGKRGSKDFLNNIRGKEKVENVLDDVNQGIKQLKNEAQAQYNSVKPEVFGDKSILDPKPIKTAFNEVKNSLLDGGQKYETGGATDKALRRVGRAVNEFFLDKQNHNAKGFDAFKQRIGDILEDTPYEAKGARRVVGAVYNATKNEIGRQAPKYYELTGKYADAMDEIADLQKTFSIKGAGSTNVDTALRKVQSVMRNNVNTNYGKRLDLLNKLNNAEQIKDKVAGQFMREITPKGIQKLSATSLGGLGLYLHNIPAAVAMAAASSPRVVGEVAYKTGQLASKAHPLSQIIRELQTTGVLPYLATKGD